MLTEESEEVAVELAAENADIQLPVLKHVRINSTIHREIYSLKHV